MQNLYTNVKKKLKKRSNIKTKKKNYIKDVVQFQLLVGIEIYEV